MKKARLFKNLFASLVLACTFITPMTLTSLQAASYQVVFKAGSHGTVDGSKEVSYSLSTEDSFPNEPDVAPESGYVFKGWNKQLPAVGSKVTGKEVYVAKYDVLIEGLNYTVRYVDENDVDIATARTVLGEKGTTYTLRAKQVAGYTYQLAQQDVTLSSENTVVKFVYTLTDPKVVIRNETVYENEIIDQVVNQTPNQTPNQGDNNNPTPPADDDIIIDDNDQPQGDGTEEEIPDNKQPQADGKTESNSQGLLLGGITAAVVVLAGIVILVVKKRKEAKE